MSILECGSILDLGEHKTFKFYISLNKINTFSLNFTSIESFQPKGENFSHQTNVTTLMKLFMCYLFVSNMLNLHLEASSQDPNASGPDPCGNRIQFHSVPDPGHVRYRGTYFTYQSFVFHFVKFCVLCRRARRPEREQSYFELACGRVQHGGQPGGGGGSGFATSTPCQETRLETSLFDDLLYSTCSHCAMPTLEF